MDARSTSSLWAALAPPALLFLLSGAIGWAMVSGHAAAFDRRVFLAVAEWARGVGLGPFAQFATLLGDWPIRILASLLGAGALVVRQRARDAALLVAMVLVGWALVSLLKDWMARPRPAILPRLDHFDSFAFPSGHSANGAIVYLGLALLLGSRRPPWLLVAAALVMLIGLSRIVLGVHWPTDVLAGWALGSGWVLLWCRLSASYSR